MKRSNLSRLAVVPRRQQGMALIIVLWLIVLLGIIASGHMHNVHIDTKLASRQLQLATARAQTDAGVQHAILELLLQDPTEPWPLDGTVDHIDFNGTEVRIAIRDATGLIDLNAANADLLSALVGTLNADPAAQEQIVASILDWRDADDLTHLNGAEDSDYQAAGHAWSARDGAFSSVDELRYVMGMTQQRFNDLAPFVTVYSQQSGINLEFAAPYLVTALTGQTIQPAETRQTRAAKFGAANRHSGTYHIYASAAADDGVEASAEVVIRISPDNELPYSVLYWREPMRVRFPEAELAGI